MRILRYLKFAPEKGILFSKNSASVYTWIGNFILYPCLNKVIGKMLGQFCKSVAQVCRIFQFHLYSIAGAATTCYVALNPQVQGVTGEYFMDCNISKPNVQARDAEMTKKLWDFSTDLIK
ncbi:hypothetical protein ACOSQ4_027818 [Xanthoceras sorbifolium]